jgi:hypothetical protein
MQFGDGARRCIIPSNVAVETVFVTLGGPARVEYGVADGLDLAGGTSTPM